MIDKIPYIRIGLSRLRTATVKNVSEALNNPYVGGAPLRWLARINKFVDNDIAAFHRRSGHPWRQAPRALVLVGRSDDCYPLAFVQCSHRNWWPDPDAVAQFESGNSVLRDFFAAWRTAPPCGCAVLPGKVKPVKARAGTPRVPVTGAPGIPIVRLKKSTAPKATTTWDEAARKVEEIRRRVAEGQYARR